MAGFIDTSTDDALWSSYNGGRVNVGKQSTKVSPLAQWSALLDANTCDFCGWADERIFDTSVEPYDPPMHHGCRCIIALILKSEFPPNYNKRCFGAAPALVLSELITLAESLSGSPACPSWKDGPPKSSFPPGRKNGVDKRGKPTARNEGKLRSETALDKKADKWMKKLPEKGEVGKRARWHDSTIADMASEDGG